jgi:hypothetical protein
MPVDHFVSIFFLLCGLLLFAFGFSRDLYPLFLVPLTKHACPGNGYIKRWAKSCLQGVAKSMRLLLLLSHPSVLNL